MAGRCPDPANVRPNPPLGTFLYVPLHHDGERTEPNPDMLAARRFPPSCYDRLLEPTALRSPYPAFAPNSHIGPVVGVDHTPSLTAVLIHQHWVTIWTCRPAAPPERPTPTMGIHHLRPLPVPVPARSICVWDQPFPDLWPMDSDFGISHVSAPGRYHPPRFLLTGAAWFRLYQAREFIRLASVRPAFARAAGDLWLYGLDPSDRQVVARILHRYLDYPPAPASPRRRAALRLQPRGLGLTIIQLPGAVPRARITMLLRDWIRRWRAVRTQERHRLIRADRLLPGAILALDHTIWLIAAYL